MTDTRSSDRTSSVAEAGQVVLDALCAENRAAAARVRACHRLYEICEDAHFDQLFTAGYDPESDNRSDYAVVDPAETASAEIVAVYGVHLHRAKAMLTLALDLVLKFPAIVDAMETGRLDERTAAMLANQMRTVDAMHRPAVHKAVVDWLMAAIDSGRRPGRHAILSQTDRIIEEHDPEGVLNRRRAALNGRNVQLRRGLDGMAVLYAKLSAMDASAIFSALQHSAREQVADERAARASAAARGESGRIDFSTERSLDQRRADALVDALLGTHASGAPGSDTPPAAAEAGPDRSNNTNSDPVSGSPLVSQLRPQITVLAPLGPNGEPEVYLPRGGQAAIDALIALLARSVGANITVPDPEPGAADSPHAALRYRIGTDLARRIRLRDGTCRHPGCSVPAEDCDVDHIRPFSHADPSGGGLTVESNLMCLCRSHHRFKTFHDWRYRLSRDGTVTVTTSTGHTITTDPTGPLARWRQQTSEGDSPHDEPIAGSTSEAGAHPHWLDPKPQRTHWFKRTQRLAAERRANYIARNAPTSNDLDDDPPPF